MAKRLRVIVAGQLPPPIGGQNIMIQEALAQFRRSPACRTEHLSFFFTPEMADARRGGIRKVVELLRVIGRLLGFRLVGPIDLLLYPAGGPQRVPLVRDLLLFPWALALSKRVVIQFHAAGIGDRLVKGNGFLPRLVASLYRRAFAAVVHSNFNRCDPEVVGMNRIVVVPCRIVDEFDPPTVRRGGRRKVRLLYAGHLCADKGTPELLGAYAMLREPYPELELELMGECLPPFTQEHLEQLLSHLAVQSHVRVAGVLTGRAKAEAFGRADLFVFPTVAPYESFGLVLAEAMSWELPIVASDWRGNKDVLTDKAGAICFPVTSDLTADIVTAVKAAFERSERWEEWGRVNRTIFQERYCDTENAEWLVRPMLSLIDSNLPGRSHSGST